MTVPVYAMTDTWNAGATVFTGIGMNVTNTAAAALSAFIDLQQGGTSNITLGLKTATSNPALWMGDGGSRSASNYTILSVGNLGSNDVYLAGGGSVNFQIGAGTPGSFANTRFNLATNYPIEWGDVDLYRDGATATLAVSHTTNATAFRVYNTTDTVASGAPTNYERGVFDWTTTANTLTIGTQAGGSGTLRSIQITGKASSGGNYLLDGANKSMAWDSAGIYLATGGGLGWSNTGDPYATTVASLINVTTTVLGFGGGNFASGPVGWMQWAGERRVTSNVSVSNSTTLATVTGISSVVIQNGRTYSFEAWLPCSCGASAGGVQFGITCSSTVITTLTADCLVVAGSSVTQSVTSSTGTSIGGVTTASSQPVARINGTINASSGTFGILFAQNASNGTASVVSSGAYLLVYDMP